MSSPELEDEPRRKRVRFAESPEVVVFHADDHTGRDAGTATAVGAVGGDVAQPAGSMDTDADVSASTSSAAAAAMPGGSTLGGGPAQQPHVSCITAGEMAAAEAARKRRHMRWMTAAEDMSVLEELEEAEEAYDEPEELFTSDGIPIEPFHLRRERAEGFFDGEGNYVEYRLEPVSDAWLDSLGDGPLDPSLAAKLQAAAAAARGRQGFGSAAAAAAGVGGGYEGDEAAGTSLDEDDAAIYKKRIVDLLLPKENVLAALRRLGGRAGRQGSPVPTAAAGRQRQRQRSKQHLKQQQQQQQQHQQQQQQLQQSSNLQAPNQPGQSPSHTSQQEKQQQQQQQLQSPTPPISQAAAAAEPGSSPNISGNSIQGPAAATAAAAPSVSTVKHDVPPSSSTPSSSSKSPTVAGDAGTTTAAAASSSPAAAVAAAAAARTRSPKAAAIAAPMVASAAIPAVNRAAFDRLTEYADILLTNGDVNVYSASREELQRQLDLPDLAIMLGEPELNLYLDSLPEEEGQLASGGQRDTGGVRKGVTKQQRQQHKGKRPAAGGKAAAGLTTDEAADVAGSSIAAGAGADAEDVDMFEELAALDDPPSPAITQAAEPSHGNNSSLHSDAARPGPPPPLVQSAAAAATAAAVAAVGADEDGDEDMTDAAATAERAPQLQPAPASVGPPVATAAAATTTTAAAGSGSSAALAAVSGSSGTAAVNIMDGFVLDESSGCYYSSTLGYYFDPSSQLFGDASSGLWYRYVEEKGTYQLVESAK